MDIRCPSCSTLYEFNEARLKRGPINLKCSQCGHVFRVEGRKGSQAKKSSRWMMRKRDGDILYFQGLSTLQKWIVDRTVTRQDEISKTGKSWKALGEIGELSSFFLVADSIEGIEKESQSPSAAQVVTRPVPAPVVQPPSKREELEEPPAAAVETPEAPAWTGASEDDFVDPMEDDSSDDGPVGQVNEWASTKEASGDWIIGADHGRQEDVPASMSLDMSSELAPPEPLEPSRAMAGTYDDPLEDNERGGGGILPAAAVLCVLVALVSLILVYIIEPTWLGISPEAQPSSKSVSDVGGSETIAPAVEDSGGQPIPDAGLDGAAAPSLKKRPLKGEGEAAEPVERKKKQAAKGAAEAGVGFDASMRRARKSLNGGRYAEALEGYKRAASARPNNIAALCGKGRAFMALGQQPAAIKAYKQALAVSPNNGLALIGIADAYRRSGQTQLAIKHYKAYLSHHPIGPTAQRARRNLKNLGVSQGPDDASKKP